MPRLVAIYTGITCRRLEAPRSDVVDVENKHALQRCPDMRDTQYFQCLSRSSTPRYLHETEGVEIHKRARQGGTGIGMLLLITNILRGQSNPSRDSHSCSFVRHQEQDQRRDIRGGNPHVPRRACTSVQCQGPWKSCFAMESPQASAASASPFHVG